MEQALSPLISVSELFNIINADDLILIDASGGAQACSNYETKHLKGALFVDLDKQLAEIQEDVSLGGRHPLPKIENFAKTLGELGITPQSHVVVYDDKNGANAAARLWWMLRAVGHAKVQVLNGGLQYAESKNFPMASGSEQAVKQMNYPVDQWNLPLTNIDEVKQVVQREDHIVVDVRDAARYRGETEPIDLIAGHIPGAKNLPFTENLDENGLFLSESQLKSKYEEFFGNIVSENRIVHCGSGVTACHTLLAIASAGMEIPKLYVGSWSEWSRREI